MANPADWIVRNLHRSARLRAMAKVLCRGWTLRQSFHGGKICLDAVVHAYAWTGKLRYEKFDRELQDKILELSRGRDLLIDIGCNVGVMTLGVLLRNPDIRALAVDPAPRAVELVRKSLALNGLEDRAEVIRAAVAERDATMPFHVGSLDGSVIGHLGEGDTEVRTLGFAKLLNERAGGQPTLVKVDVEGYETQILPLLSDVERLDRICLVVELHPKGWNGVGDPRRCIAMLDETGATLSTDRDGQIDGKSLREDEFHQVVARWTR